jgi:3-isopropylmalate/(R)-2-methylmalate dehydratase small subunit
VNRLACSGRVWVFGDNVDTDQMAPMSAMALSADKRKPLLFPNHPAFIASMRAGDIIVAGQNWGCGSSREQAPANLQELGIVAVVAESFSRIFFRNSVARGLLAVECAGIRDAVVEGDTVTVDLIKASVYNARTDVTLAGRRYTPLMVEIVSRGGLLEVLADRVQSDMRITMPADVRKGD